MRSTYKKNPDRKRCGLDFDEFWHQFPEFHQLLYSFWVLPILDEKGHNVGVLEIDSDHPGSGVMMLSCPVQTDQAFLQLRSAVRATFLSLLSSKA
jgi:hypothetical protein